MSYFECITAQLCFYDCICVSLQSKLIYSYKMSPQTSKEELIDFIYVYQMDLVTEYNGQVL